MPVHTERKSCECVAEHKCHTCKVRISNVPYKGYDWSDNVHIFCARCFQTEVSS